MSEESINNNIEQPETNDQSNKSCMENHKGRCYKLSSFDWLKDVSAINNFPDIVEVRFKNTRKGFFHNSNGLNLAESDIVAVEASPGHDIGIVSMTGQLVREKLRYEGIDYRNHEFKKIYRKAKQADIDKWKEAVDIENTTMFRARKIAENLKLEMKIGDVEYQGDKTKAIFYYIADDRVDFRELIKVMAEEFRVRIEMRQIGTRQEAGRIGGIGSCGRELCCSAFITNFVSVTTSAARYQEVSLNPQKLAGQCGKLKCCLNYEVDAYLDAQEDFPDTSKPLNLKEGKAFHQKTDVFKRLMWYSINTEKGQSIICISVDQIKEIIEMNEKGETPEKIKGVEESSIASVIEYQNAVGSESLTRFEDTPTQSRNNGKKKKFRPKGRNFRRNE